MNNSTYTKVTSPSASAEKLLELWESFNSTKLFTLEVSFDSGLVHRYNLKNTKICIVACSSGVGLYDLKIFDEDEEISSEEFWNRIPKEYQKILVYHLDQLV